MHLAGEGVFQLFADAETVEHWLRLGVELDFVRGALGDFGNHFAHPVVGFGVVHHNALDVLGKKVAHGALNQIRFLKHARRHRLFLDAFLNLVPFLDEKREVAHEVTELLAIPAVIRLARTLAVQRAALAVTVILSGVLYVGALHRMTSRSDFDHVFGQLSTRDYLRSMPDGSLFEMTLALDADPPRPGPVLMIGEKRSLYLKRPFIPDFDLDNVGALYRNGGGTAEGMAALLRRSGVHDILEHSIMARELLRPEERRAYNEMVSLFTETKAQDSYLVWRTVRD